jgi:transposase IS116/IS110/IS902 family protein
MQHSGLKAVTDVRLLTAQCGEFLPLEHRHPWVVRRDGGQLREADQLGQARLAKPLVEAGISAATSTIPAPNRPGASALVLIVANRHIHHACLPLLGELFSRNVPSCASKRLPFIAAVDDPVRFRRSRDIVAYLGFVPHRYQSGNFDYTCGSSKCGDLPTSLPYSS